MVYLDLIKIVLKDVYRKKFSSFLTFLSISLGIFAIFMIIILSVSFQSSIQHQFEKLGSNKLYITSVTTNFANPSTLNKGLTDGDVNLIKSKSFVQSAFPFYSRKTKFKLGNNYAITNVYAVKFNKKFFLDLNLNIAKGRFPSSNEKFSIILGSKAAQKNGVFSKNIPLGANLYIKGTKFRVVGILKSYGNPTDDSSIYANIDTIRNIYHAGNNVGFIYAIINKGYNISLAATNLKRSLENRIGKGSINILTPTQLLSQVSSILDIVKFSLGGIAFVALLVGALGIINTMFVIITEKIKDIGIMKSIGATNSEILFMFIFQAGLFGFLGAIIGIILGSLGAILFGIFARQMGFDFLKISITPIIVFSLLAFGFIIGVIAGFLPAYKASKIKLVEAISKWYQF